MIRARVNARLRWIGAFAIAPAIAASCSSSEGTGSGGAPSSSTSSTSSSSTSTSTTCGGTGCYTSTTTSSSGCIANPDVDCAGVICGQITNGCGVLVRCPTNCVDEGPESCGTTGLCDNDNTCARYTGSTACGLPTCTAGEATAPAHCDGSGTCVPGATSTCGAEGCNAGVCGTTCAKDTDCPELAWCDGGTCAAKKPSSTTCASNHECVSGLCSDGACTVGCAVAVSAGVRHTCAQRADGTLWCWGAAWLGDGNELGGPFPTRVKALGTNVIQVAAGADFTCAIKNDGTLWCWGFNPHGELGNGSKVDATSPVQVAALGSGVVQIAVGGNHACAVKDDGSLWCWGSNEYGQLGIGAPAFPGEGKLAPVQVTALGTSVAKVATSTFTTCAIKDDGSLWCWGRNWFGELGDGTTMDKASPAQVATLGTSVVEAAVGAQHACARKIDGTVECWGKVTDGELGDGTTTAKLSPVQVVGLGGSTRQISVGSSHTCALLDGTIWCWGQNPDGELGNGETAIRQLTPDRVRLECP